MTLTQSQFEYILRVRMNNIEKHVGREAMLTLRSRLTYTIAGNEVSGLASCVDLSGLT